LDDQGLIYQFETIEKRLDALIKICKDKDNQNKELIFRIKKLEEELRTKVEAEQRYAEEKALVRSRVDQLLMRLEEIAKADSETSWYFQWLKTVGSSLEQMITIEILGQRYTFKADDGLVDPQNVAQFLMEEVRKLETGQADQTADTNRFVMLLQAALNISSDHLKLKQQLAAVSDRISLKTERLHGALNPSVVSPRGGGAVAG
jgi:cell division protein ZapA (FtsZ GTPase activity inhibitor)